MTNINVLKARLEKLKDKESRLEADLAIRDHPEVEECVYDIIVCYADLKQVINEIKICRSKVNVRTIENNQKQLEFFRRKLETLEGVDSRGADIQRRFYLKKIEVIEAAGPDRIPAYEGLQVKLEKCKRRLRDVCDKHFPTLENYKFNTKKLLPSVYDILNNK